MNIQHVNLSQISVNQSNPRQIKDTEFEKLIISILVLPKMLELRPIVVDNIMTALGGNMRYRALCAISEYEENELRARLNESKDFQKKSDGEQNALIDFWLKWHENPTAPIIKASELTDQEQREFIIKDNVGFGKWDMDMLANEWDGDELCDWGLDIPIIGNDFNADDFFNLDKETSKTEKEKITIILPDSLSDKKDDIKAQIEITLADYADIKIK